MQIKAALWCYGLADRLQKETLLVLSKPAMIGNSAARETRVCFTSENSDFCCSVGGSHCAFPPTFYVFLAGLIIKLRDRWTGKNQTLAHVHREFTWGRKKKSQRQWGNIGWMCRFRQKEKERMSYKMSKVRMSNLQVIEEEQTTHGRLILAWVGQRGWPSHQARPGASRGLRRLSWT